MKALVASILLSTTLAIGATACAHQQLLQRSGPQTRKAANPPLLLQMLGASYAAAAAGG